MKLNLRPNIRKKAVITSIRCIQIALSLPFLANLVTCAESITPSSDISTRNQITRQIERGGDGEHINHPATNQTKQTSTTNNNSSSQHRLPSTSDVTNLHLMSDFRSVKLRWSYEHSDANEPASFNVRYCELTSWNIEIKCRHRDMRVDSTQSPVAEQHNQQPEQTNTGHKDNSVIKAPVNTVHQLDPPEGHNYEAQIYDLRALTNYTFHVQVSRFIHQLTTSDGSNRTGQTAQVGFQQMDPRRQNRSQAARRLEVVHGDTQDELVGRIETKPFGAEATKCLADVSELVVNTGRYFGGRISVEDSTDPRCSLAGNKSSEQTTYLFRIDHEVCNSKVLDGNRIETMVLVHENKDILTHNTARFLVLCNFLQKSFTLRAAVSLPKVNGIVAPSRPALITSLPGRPGVGEHHHHRQPGEDQQQAVMLGSMPGIYRAKSGQQTNETAIEQQLGKMIIGNKSDVASNGTSTNQLAADELETNTIEKFTRPNGGMRHSKELGYEMQRRNSNNMEGRARSLTLSSELSGEKSLPQPVQVQSKVLYVERTNSARSARQRQYNRLLVGQPQQQQVTPNLAEHSSQKTADTGELRTTTSPTIDNSRDPRNLRQQLAKLKSDELSADLQAAPIIMTNNHRVSGDYLPVSQAKSLADNNYSIKYSTAKVDEYPLGRGFDIPLVELNNAAGGGGQIMRSRTGRMQSIVENDQQLSSVGTAAAADPTATRTYKQPPAWTVNRMGEMIGEGGDLVAETSNETNRYTSVANSTLAQNITSYLLKWSLKTLTNLARKSLESLLSNKGDNNNDTELLEQPHQSNEILPLVGDRELRTSDQLDLKRVSLTPETTTTKKPIASGFVQRSASYHHQNSATNEPNSQLATISPVTQKSHVDNKSAAEELLDGFMTNTRRDDDKATQTTTTIDKSQVALSSTSKANENYQASRHHTRPSNYSKSLDFNRDESSSSVRQKNSESGKLNSSGRHRQMSPGSSSNIVEQPDQSLSPQRNESVRNNRDAFYSSWAFYGLVVLVALITGIFLTFWLVSSPLTGASSPNISNQNNLDRTIHPIAFDDSTLPALVFGNDNNMNNSPQINRGIRDVSAYQKYDYNKFENYSNETINKSGLLGATKTKQHHPSQRSPTNVSRSTRSTSVGSSTLLADENDCKNNEFLYTEHVLINTGSSFGESYA